MNEDKKVYTKPPQTQMVVDAEPVAWFMQLWNEGDQDVRSDVRWGNPTVDDISRAEHNGHDIEYLYDRRPAASPAPHVVAIIDSLELPIVGHQWLHHDPDTGNEFWLDSQFLKGKRSNLSRAVYLDPKPAIRAALAKLEDQP